jgi:hypothetical protein
MIDTFVLKHVILLAKCCIIGFIFTFVCEVIKFHTFLYITVSDLIFILICNGPICLTLIVTEYKIHNFRHF